MVRRSSGCDGWKEQDVWKGDSERPGENEISF